MSLDKVMRAPSKVISAAEYDAIGEEGAIRACLAETMSTDQQHNLLDGKDRAYRIGECECQPTDASCKAYRVRVRYFVWLANPAQCDPGQRVAPHSLKPDPKPPSAPVGEPDRATFGDLKFVREICGGWERMT